MPLKLVEEGRPIAREKLECLHCGETIKIKYDSETNEVLWVHGASNPDEEGLIQCYNCRAVMRWSPP